MDHCGGSFRSRSYRPSPRNTGTRPSGEIDRAQHVVAIVETFRSRRLRLGHRRGTTAVLVEHEDFERERRMHHARRADILAVGRPARSRSTRPPPSSCEICRGLLPSTLATQRLLAPERSLMKANCLPSGENTGLASNAAPDRTDSCLTAGAADGIDVAQQIEQDALAVGRHIRRHPGALVRLEGDVTRRCQR